MTGGRESIVWIREARQIDALLAENKRPFFLLKHSTRCPVSSRALLEVETKGSCFEGEAVWVLDILKYRDWSTRIAEYTGIRHESPQLLYLHHGECIAHWNHFEIESSSISTVLRSLREKEG